MEIDFQSNYFSKRKNFNSIREVNESISVENCLPPPDRVIWLGEYWRIHNSSNISDIIL